MNRLALGLAIGAIAIVTTLSVSATENSTNLSDINQIKDPYEQCLAYVKMKGLTNVDCKARVESMKQAQGPKKEERKEERKDDKIMRGTGMLSQSGTMEPKPPRPQMGSGVMMGSGAKMMEQEMKGLGLAIGQLKGEERMELMKIIRTYLESKGVKIPTPESKKNDNEKDRDETVKGKILNQENKKQQEAMREFIKALQEKAKQKEYTGHITLMK